MVYACVIVILTGYLLGNLNGAVCVSSLIAGDDVRKHGSGNAGLTNFIRNYGSGYALMVVGIDSVKAVLACLMAELILKPYGYGPEGMMLGGVAVMLGHVYPVLLGGKGGTGILSGFVISLVFDWRIGFAVFAVFAVAYLLTGYVSLGSVLAALTFGAMFVLLHQSNWFVMLCGLLICALAVFMHRGNILRLLKGQERKTNLFAKKKSE